jgi:hypothetical protein
MKTRFTVAAVAVAALTAPAFAGAQSAAPSTAGSAASGLSRIANNPTAAQYQDTPKKGVGGTSASGSSGGGSSPSSSGGGGQLGSLPFTGADLAALLAIAVCLLASGAVIKSLSRPRRD